MTENEHQHDNGQSDHLLSVAEEPLDPANQSLADALRASFRVLKFIMIFVLVVFVFSGVFIVDQTKVAVLARFGKQVGGAREPGLHFAFPYPIDEIIQVTTSPKTLEIDDFWLVISEANRFKDLSDLRPRSNSLDPAVDGALLTGDKAIMHVSLHVQYYMGKPNDFVQNVGDDDDERPLLRAVLQNAAVAEAARTTADAIWRDPSQLSGAIQSRAQRKLEDLRTGLVLENVAADKHYFPLQAKDAFLGVSDAENRKIRAINAAESERVKQLNAAAGEAWKALNERIEKLDQLPDGPQRDAIIKEIEKILVDDATGEAGSTIQLARSTKDKIIAAAQQEANRFDVLLGEYRRSPKLLIKRMRQRMLNDLFEQPGVIKWLLPEGKKQINLWLNRDPKEMRDAERRRMEEITAAGR